MDDELGPWPWPTLPGPDYHAPEVYAIERERIPALERIVRPNLATDPARRDASAAAFVAAGGSVPEAAARVGVRPSTAKRRLADRRARSGLTTVELVYAGLAAGWLAVPDLEPDRNLIRP